MGDDLSGASEPRSSRIGARARHSIALIRHCPLALCHVATLFQRCFDRAGEPRERQRDPAHWNPTRTPTPARRTTHKVTPSLSSHDFRVLVFGGLRFEV